MDRVVGNADRPRFDQDGERDAFNRVRSLSVACPERLLCRDANVFGAFQVGESDCFEWRLGLFLDFNHNIIQHIGGRERDVGCRLAVPRDDNPFQLGAREVRLSGWSECKRGKRRGSIMNLESTGNVEFVA